MRAVILAGGQGTRLAPYTTIVPKPLIPVAGRPVLDHILHHLADHGVTRVDLCIGHLGELIQAYFSQAEDLPPDLDVRWHRESEPLGTAGAICAISDLPETFIVANGDVISMLDPQDLLATHREKRASLTVAMQAKLVDVDLGVIRTNDGIIESYEEKPALELDVSVGIYAFDRRALDFVPNGGPFQFPELVNRLIECSQVVAAHRTDAACLQIGTFEEHEQAAAVIPELGLGRRKPE